MSKIIIHIGLPKTATSSLQHDYYTKLDENRIKYLGIKLESKQIGEGLFTKREKKQNKLFLHFYKSVVTGTGIEEIKNALESELNKGFDVLISEEMIVVNNWQSKLKNLFDIIKDFKYLIIVSVREPVSAMFSYYIELYHVFRKTKKQFSELALSNNYMKIYHYRLFFNFLFNNFDQNRIKILKFEEIINGNMEELDQIFLRSGKINLQNHNLKKSDSEFIFQEVYLPVNVSALVINLIKKLKIIKKGSFPKLKQILLRILNLFTIIKIKKDYKIRKLTNEELELISLKIKDETAFLKERFGIDYLSTNCK